jgi:RNA-binding protein 39
MQKLSREEQDKTDNGQSIKAHNYTNHPVVPPVAPISQMAPTNCVLLNNMFDPAQVDLRKDPAFYLDIKEQVEDVCRELSARVEKVWVEQNSGGNVWVRFARSDLEGAMRISASLNQRYFDQRLITANYVPETVFNSKVKER